MRVTKMITALAIIVVILYVLRCRRFAGVSSAELLRTARTGDLVLFRNERRPWYYLAALPITHIGVVIRRGGQPWVLEMHQVGDAPPGYDAKADGPHVYPLEARIAESLNGGRWRLFHAPYLGPEVTADTAWAFPPAYVPYNYAYIKDELRCHALGRIPRISMDTMHCGHYAAWALQRLGIAPADRRIDCIVPLDALKFGSYGKIQRVVK